MREVVVDRLVGGEGEGIFGREREREREREIWKDMAVCLMARMRCG